MHAHVAKSPIGYFAFADDGTLLYYELFLRNVTAILQKLAQPIPDSFLSQLRAEKISEDDIASAHMRAHLREYAVSLGFVSSDDAFTAFLQEFGIAFSRQALSGAIGRDKLLIQATHAFDDLTKHLNLFQERLYEWFTLHYPEVSSDHEKLVSQVAAYGSRERFPGFSSSLGVSLTPDDEVMVKEFAAMIVTMQQTRDDLERYMHAVADEIIPNISGLIDTLLACRLVAHAGSLEKLAKMPASTIQLLGAEKALFRHLKKQGKSPKYGILFLSTRIQQAPDAAKGKVARILAAKLMLAARIDFYSGRNDGEKLRAELNKELAGVLR